MAGKRFYNNVNKPFILVKWKIEVNHSIISGSTVLTYIFQKDFSEPKDNVGPQKLKSSVRGVVLNLLVKEGDVVQPGEPLLEFDSCSHEIMLKGICAGCGKDMWSSHTFQIFEGIDLTVTEEQAKLLKKAGEDSLLCRRKLVLLICADNILVDITTTQKLSPTHEGDKNLESTVQEQVLSTKLLPGACEFLETVFHNYDVYFFTHGGSLQGEKICRMLNEECQIFPHHVWTKDDFCGSETNEKKLQLIFPNGHSMVCIVDCNEDVWQFDSNVVFVLPYNAFYESLKDTHNLAFRALQHKSKVDGNTASAVNSFMEIELKNVTDKLKLQEMSKTDLTNEDILLKSSHDSNSQTQSNSLLFNVRKKSCTFLQTDCHDDSVNYMSYLKAILRNIHKGYYYLLNQMALEQMYIIHHQVIPHLKFVIPYVRQSVLKGINLVFSGLIPVNVEAKSCPFWIMAESLGASVSNDLILFDEEGRTTHIIAAKAGTDKLNKVKHFKKIYVVTIDWLYDCAFRWYRVKEDHFLLKDDTVSDKGAHLNMSDDVTDRKQDVVSNGDSKDTVKTPKNTDAEVSSLNEIPNTSCNIKLDLTSEELDKMAKEVEHEIETDDSDEEGKPAHLTTVKRKIRSEWNFHPIQQALWKQKKYETSPRSSPWRDEEASNTSFPEWEPLYNTDSNYISESESPMIDYIWSEDEDTFLTYEYE